jgi:ubiquinone/menaquinone biosynthesis C-methylase UbiE
MTDRDVDRSGRWAPNYDRSFLQRALFGPVQDATIAAAAGHSARPRVILDVGCGTGQLLGRLAARFPAAELVGADAAAGMIEQARAAVSGDLSVRFVTAFAEELPFPDASFDLVTSTVSFHHWADQRRGLREVRRVLNPGGLFILTDALADGWLWEIFAVGGGGRFLRPGELDAMLVTERLRFVGRSSVSRVRAIKVTLARAAG